MKKKISAILLLTSTIILSNCKNYSVVAVYEDIWKDTYHRLELLRDSTFSYRFKEGMINDSTEGRWEQKRNTLILNSFITPNDVCSYCHIEACDSCKEGIEGTVFFYSSNKPVYFASVKSFLNGVWVASNSTDFDGRFKIEEQNIDSVEVEFTGTNSITFAPVKDTGHFYRVVLKDESLKRKLIHNEIWKVKKNRIIGSKGSVLYQISRSRCAPEN